VPTGGPFGRVTLIASQQHGVFSRRQAREGGCTEGQIDWRIHTGAWHVVDHGVYATAGTATSWHQRLLAACLAGPAVASHRAAAALWAFPGFEEPTVEVTAIRHLRRHAASVIWHESHHLSDRDVTELTAIPVTRAARTIVDLGSVVDEALLLSALDDALRRSLVSIASVQTVLESFDSRRLGSGAVRRALKRRPAMAAVPESVLESAFDELVHTHGLPAPTRQYRVRAHDGSVIARVDFAYPAARLAIEIDSVRHHAGTLDWRQDLVRMNRLVSADWRTLRFTADDLRHRPRGVGHAICDALAVKRRI
jgi:very-short-patch-repair endonuclease